MLSPIDKAIYEAFRSGNRHLYKLSIVTTYNHRIVKESIQHLCSEHYLTRTGKGKYELSEPTKEDENTIEYLYYNLPRKELAKKLEMSKFELNQLLIKIGLGK